MTRKEAETQSSLIDANARNAELEQRLRETTTVLHVERQQAQLAETGLAAEASCARERVEKLTNELNASRQMTRELNLLLDEQAKVGSIELQALSSIQGERIEKLSRELDAAMLGAVEQVRASNKEIQEKVNQELQRRLELQGQMVTLEHTHATERQQLERQVQELHQTQQRSPRPGHVSSTIEELKLLIKSSQEGVGNCWVRTETECTDEIARNVASASKSTALTLTVELAIEVVTAEERAGVLATQLEAAMQETENLQAELRQATINLAQTAGQLVTYQEKAALRLVEDEFRERLARAKAHLEKKDAGTNVDPPVNNTDHRVEDDEEIVWERSNSDPLPQKSSLRNRRGVEPAKLVVKKVSTTQDDLTPTEEFQFFVDTPTHTVAGRFEKAAQAVKVTVAALAAMSPGDRALALAGMTTEEREAARKARKAPKRTAGDPLEKKTQKVKAAARNARKEVTEKAHAERQVCEPYAR